MITETDLLDFGFIKDEPDGDPYLYTLHLPLDDGSPGPLMLAVTTERNTLEFTLVILGAGHLFLNISNLDQLKDFMSVLKDWVPNS